MHQKEFGFELVSIYFYVSDSEGESPLTRLAGVRPLTPGELQPINCEEYELSELESTRCDSENCAKYRATKAQQADNIPPIDEFDDMKFSHSIQFNAVPDWSCYYISYSNLKKL